MYHPKPECVLLYTYNLYRQMQIFLEVVLQMQKTFLSEIPEVVSKSFICIKSLVVLEAVISSPLNARLREQLN